MSENLGFQNTDKSIWMETDESGFSVIEAVEFPPDTDSHKNVLLQLFPVELRGRIDEWATVVGAQLDTVMARSNDLLTEMFADTSVEMFKHWEELYGIPVDETKPMYLRRQLLLAKINAAGSITVAALKRALKEFVGYEPEVENYHYARCDDPYTLTDDERFVFTDEYIYQLTVYIDNALIQTSGYSKADIQTVINDYIPAYAQGILDTGVYGFFCDDTDSLTELTLLAT